jgi:hypothetical protein
VKRFSDDIMLYFFDLEPDSISDRFDLKLNPALGREYGLIWAISASLSGKPCAAAGKTLIQRAWGL